MVATTLTDQSALALSYNDTSLSYCRQFCIIKVLDGSVFDQVKDSFSSYIRDNNIAVLTNEFFELHQLLV